MPGPRRYGEDVGDMIDRDATAQAEAVRRHETSPAELVDTALARIEERNPALNAVIHHRADKARAEAAGALPDGPFRGVPMVLKDLTGHSAGDPFHEGTQMLRDLGWTEADDTFLVSRLRQAGFVFVGRTNVPEFGLVPSTEPLAYGPSRNPWDPGRSTGGSSGGSAAAVAAGMVAVGHANDGGGSIRIPASECGLFGLKPSRARVSIGPEYHQVWEGFECEHVVTRSVRDSAAVLDVLCGPMPGDPYVAPPSGPYLEAARRHPGQLRVGVLRADPTGAFEVHADCAAALEQAAALLGELGHGVEEAAPAALADPEFTPNFITVYSAYADWCIEDTARRTGRPAEESGFEPATWALAQMAREVTPGRYLLAVQALYAQARRIRAWWEVEGWDLLLTPTIPEPPPVLGQFAATPDNPLAPLLRSAAIVPFTAPFNVTGQPAASLPLHWSEDGLPIGVQLVAAYGREDLLFAVSAQLEQALPWEGRRPPLWS